MLLIASLGAGLAALALVAAAGAAAAPVPHHVASGESGVISVGADRTGPRPAPAGMVWIPGGVFRMGCDDPAMPEARPIHPVEVDGFWMDQTTVTNRQFAEFVRATGYVTVAERPLDPAAFPGAPRELLVPGSVVFNPPARPVPLTNPLAWWKYQPGANWRHPEGPGSDLTGRDDHPVVQVAWEDAAAYARWAGKRLPTEAEFEFAARGGMNGVAYAWGAELKPGGRWAANVWQGDFPAVNQAEDGYRGTSPVRAFAPNPFGLYDMGGNVWQWCSDWYREDYFAAQLAQGTVRNPAGPERSLDPHEPNVPKRVQKGGSFLCTDQYCSRYHLGSRGKGAVDTGSSNVGFRCVL